MRFLSTPDKRGKIPNTTPISKRPAGAENRSRYGHWESDTVLGMRKTGCFGTHVERKSGYLIAFRIDDRQDNAFNTALRKKLCKNNQLQKNDFVVRTADRSLSFLFQYKLNTAVCQATDAKYPDFTALRSVASGYFAAASVQPVRIHYLKLTQHLAPVPKRHCPFFGYLRCCRIQSL